MDFEVEPTGHEHFGCQAGYPSAKMQVPGAVGVCAAPLRRDPMIIQVNGGAFFF